MSSLKKEMLRAMDNVEAIVGDPCKWEIYRDFRDGKDRWIVKVSDWDDKRVGPRPEWSDTLEGAFRLVYSGTLLNGEWDKHRKRPR